MYLCIELVIELQTWLLLTQLYHHGTRQEYVKVEGAPFALWP